MSEDTIFHKIIREELPSDKVHEDEQVIVIRDISPVAPTHMLVIPKKTIRDVRVLEQEDQALMGHMLIVARQVAAEQGLDARGYRLVFNAGEDGGQAVDQLHLHVIGGRELSWPPG